MNKILFLILLLTLNHAVFAQYWQQHLDYVIDVSLNDKEKTIDAFEKITYTNNSPDTLTYIWFHLWPNAYKNDRTAFSDQALELGDTRFYFSDKEERGYINRLDFKVDGITAKTEDHPQHIDIVRVLLPKPLVPGGQAVITTPFHVKLPYNFSRGGYDGSSFQLTQWYPKPAVYDRKGWHPLPYLDQGEFFSEFGRYDVRITVPENYIIAATGQLQNETEKAFLHNRKKPTTVKTAAVKKPAYGKTGVKSVAVASPPVKTKTLNYIQDNVHDFAWFANKDFIVDKDTCQLPSGRIIDVYSFYTEKEEKLWKNSLQYAKDALRFYSGEVGEYPYPVASVVQGPKSFGGGMEYPTITVISPVPVPRLLDEVIAHELGHNWFYGILASNERDHPWMDEGINTFYEYKYMQGKYGRESNGLELLFQTKAFRKTDQPIEEPADAFTEINYGLVVYHKTATWMKWMESQLGQAGFRKLMQDYFQQWKFRHPYPEDFRAVFENGGAPADYFSWLNKKGMLPGQQANGFHVISPFIRGSIKKYINESPKHTLLLSPALGVNSYDRLMIGALVTNYKLPPNKFQFLLTPMYATGSKQFAGLGKLNYSTVSSDARRKVDLFLNGSRFAMDEFRDTANRKLTMSFSKLVPGARITFRKADPKSTVSRYIQWKTFFITEQSLRIFPDTTITGTDTTLFLRYLRPSESRYLNQLRFVYENYRGLYPFNLSLQVEQAKDFVRPTITGNYFFNYRDGGINLRLFAGKFIYLGEKTISKQFANDRYHLNMTGPKGYEDYTYSDYFLGRNRFEELESQQIMERDGFFKVRTDLLSSKIGKTDNWLAAINLDASVPEKLNPLSLLPVKIPLRLFMDIGTYAEGWKKDAENDRFLYDAGIHIPLFDETVNFYFPILYNQAYSDYIKSIIPKNRFFKSMSFTIQFFSKSLKKLNHDLEL